MTTHLKQIAFGAYHLYIFEQKNKLFVLIVLKLNKN